MAVRKGITHHIIPFKHSIAIDESLAAGEITSGSGRRLPLAKFNGVSLDNLTFKVSDLTATGIGASGEYAFKAYFEGKIAGESTNVIGTTAAVNSNGVTEVSEVVSVDAKGDEFDWAEVGIEVTGGTTGASFDIEAFVNVKGDTRGSVFVLPASGQDSFVQPGSGLAFNAVTTNFDATFAAEATDL